MATEELQPSATRYTSPSGPESASASLLLRNPANTEKPTDRDEIREIHSSGKQTPTGTETRFLILFHTGPMEVRRNCRPTSISLKTFPSLNPFTSVVSRLVTELLSSPCLGCLSPLSPAHNSLAVWHTCWRYNPASLLLFSYHG